MEKNLIIFWVFTFLFLFSGPANGEIAGGKHVESTSFEEALKQKLWKSTVFAEKVSGKAQGSRKKKGAVKSREIVVEGINFKAEKYGPEKILIYLNRFYLPKTFAIEGKQPRIVVDIENVSSWEGKPVIDVDGFFVKMIRTHLHPTAGKLRIVLDLNPSKNYVADQKFYKKNNAFCITIGAGTENATETNLKKPPL